MTSAEYQREYYKRHREAIISRLGGVCTLCGNNTNLDIHHKNGINKRKGRGRLDRLTDWRRDSENLELLCRSCHNHHHKGNCEHKPVPHDDKGRLRCEVCGILLKSNEVLRE